MSTSNHAAAKVASALGGIAALATLAEAARLASHAAGTKAGVAVIAAVFAACWIVSRVRPLLHPAPARRSSLSRDPEPVAPLATLAGSAASR